MTTARPALILALMLLASLAVSACHVPDHVPPGQAKHLFWEPPGQAKKH